MRWGAVFALLLAACDGVSTGPSLGDAEPGPAPMAAIAIATPAEGAPLADRFVTVKGTAAGLTRVDVQADDGPLVRAALGTEWSATLALTPGKHVLRAVGQGADGTTVQADRTVFQGTTVRLAAPPPPGGDVELRLDRLALQRILRPEDQRQVVLAYLDLKPLVRNALAALADPVTWGVDTAAWGPAERNLASLLTMDPDHANVEGSALAPLLQLSGRLGLASPRVFSDLLGIAPTDRILDPDLVADTLLDLVIRTHPNYVGDADGKLAVTLEDALADLAPLADRFGPTGDHPGFIAAPPKADLFTPAFAMVVRGHGNVRVLPGLRPGEGYASYVIPPAAGEPILDLDFADPERFTVEGLAPEPRAGLSMVMNEDPAFFDLGPSDAPGPRGGSAVWQSPPWTLEHLVAEATFRAFATRFPDPRVPLTYDLGAVSPAATLTWADGFVSVNVVANLGPPPPPAWIWDLVLDVAQRRLHDGGLAEGEANVRLDLPPLPIGLDADGLVAAMRPVLEAHRTQLVSLMLGDASSLANRATLWLDADAPALRVVDGAPRLFTDAAMTGEGTDAVTLGDTPSVWWTQSPEGAKYAVLLGPWRGQRVEVGLVEVE